jgi:hypothetical protein
MDIIRTFIVMGTDCASYDSADIAHSRQERFAQARKRHPGCAASSRVAAAAVAQRAFIFRTTQVRVEEGDPGVGIGTYAAVLFAPGASTSDGVGAASYNRGEEPFRRNGRLGSRSLGTSLDDALRSLVRHKVWRVASHASGGDYRLRADDETGQGVLHEGNQG